MVKKWDSNNKYIKSTKTLWWSKSEIQWINQKIGMNDFKWIMIYFSKIFLLQHIK